MSIEFITITGRTYITFLLLNFDYRTNCINKKNMKIVIHNIMYKTSIKYTENGILKTNIKNLLIVDKLNEVSVYELEKSLYFIIPINLIQSRDSNNILTVESQYDFSYEFDQ
jgi:hypothetical protein